MYLRMNGGDWGGGAKKQNENSVDATNSDM